MKKKVLTVMAALALMGGKAFAYDYQWVIKNLTKDFDPSNKKGTLVENALSFVGTNAKADAEGVKMLKDGSEASDYLEISVQKGDRVTITVFNGKSVAGTLGVVPVSSVATSTDLKPNTSTPLVLDKAADNGVVKVYASEDAVFTDITIESEAYRTVKAKYDAVLADANEKLTGVASHVNLSPTFYANVAALINEQTAKIESTWKEITEARKNNGIVDKESAFTKTFDDCKTEIGSVVDKATAAVKAYNNVTSAGDGTSPYDLAAARLAEAYNEKPSKADADADIANKEYKYIYKFEFNANGSVKSKTEKASGLRAYMDVNAKDYFGGIKEGDALKALEKFPFAEDGGSYPTAKIEALYSGVVTRIDNIIARFVIEDENTSKYEAVKSGIDLINSLKGEVFKVSDSDSKTLTDDYAALEKEWESADKHKYTAVELNGSVLVGKITNCQTTIDNIKNSWVTTAQTELQKEINAVQEHINTYSYQISSKFESDLDAQKTYQAEFAKLQAQLNDISKTNETKDFKLVEKYSENMAALEAIDGQIDTLWENASDAQNRQITDKNKENLEKNFYKDITDAKAAYSEGIEKINGYKTLDGISEEAVARIDEVLVELSKKLLALDDAWKTAQEEVKDKNLVYELWDYETASADVETKAKEINDLIVSARAVANESAYQYLTGENYDGTVAPKGTFSEDNEGTLPYVKGQLTTIEKDIEDTKNGYNSDVVKAAKAALEIVRNGGKKSDGSYKEDENKYRTEQGYVYNAEKFIKEKSAVATNEQADANKNLIADYIKDETLLGYMANAVTEAEKIQGQVVAFDELEKDINDFRIRWSVAKAKAEKMSGNSAMLETLTKANAQIETVETTLGKDLLGAKDKTESYYDVEFDKIDKMLWSVEDPDAYNANETAYAEATEELAKVKAELTAALTTVRGLETADVVTKYTEKLNGVSFKDENGNEVEDVIENAYNNKKAKEELESIKTILNGISTNIATLVEQAKDEDAASKTVPGDQNGDNVLDDQDISILMEKLSNGGDTGEFAIFLESFKNYNKEQ